MMLNNRVYQVTDGFEVQGKMDESVKTWFDLFTLYIDCIKCVNQPLAYKWLK